MSLFRCRVVLARRKRNTTFWQPNGLRKHTRIPHHHDVLAPWLSVQGSLKPKSASKSHGPFPLPRISGTTKKEHDFLAIKMVPKTHTPSPPQRFCEAKVTALALVKHTLGGENLLRLPFTLNARHATESSRQTDPKPIGRPALSFKAATSDSAALQRPSAAAALLRPPKLKVLPR